jgi:proteic killer suppression protein
MQHDAGNTPCSESTPLVDGRPWRDSTVDAPGRRPTVARLDGRRRSRACRRCRVAPGSLGRRQRTLDVLPLVVATGGEDLAVPPGNRLHVLTGDRAGQVAIAINDQGRICFRFDDGDAYEVEVCDYH